MSFHLEFWSGKESILDGLEASLIHFKIWLSFQQNVSKGAQTEAILRLYMHSKYLVYQIESEINGVAAIH